MECVDELSFGLIFNQTISISGCIVRVHVFSFYFMTAHLKIRLELVRANLVGERGGAVAGSRSLD